MTHFECPICLDNIKYASIGTCTHHFCYFCLFKHCKTSNLCPICKTEINDFRIDREFDQLVNGESLPSFKYTNEITISNINDLYGDPGITIENNANGPGVIITKLLQNGIFKKYNFCKNDIIIFINNVPCNNHKHVIDQIMNLFDSKKIIKIIKL